MNYGKKIFLTLSLIFSSVLLFAEKGPVYISPNNDGVQDVIEVPLKIKEKRYVNEWSFIIFNEKGEVVRTIGNKVPLPTKITFKTFFKALFTPKQTVEIPSSIVWNGFFDDGRLAPDGKYFYQFSATDDNGNSATTSRFVVIVDNTAPEIKLTDLAGNAKNFGEGSKAVLNIQQSGSEEKLWVAKFTDVSGNVVKTFKWEDSEPLTLSWNGSSDSDSMVSDGVYNYEISSTDLAGNKSEKAVITNIIFSTEKPQISLSLEKSKYFSPQGNSPVKTMNFNVSVPDSKSKVNALSAWALTVENKDGTEVYRTYSGSNVPPASLIKFDGKKEDSAFLPQGEYRAKLTAKYLNGYEPEPAYSPVFVLDNDTPVAAIELPTNKVFNGKDVFKISQGIMKYESAYTGETYWTGKIISSSGKIVRQFNFGTNLDSIVEWNGMDDSLSLASDGEYYYVLEVKDLAENTNTFGGKKETAFKLDTSSTELLLTTNVNAFSPNGDDIQDTVNFNVVAKASSGISSYELKVLDSRQNLIKTFNGKGSIPSSINWDGKNDKDILVQDGKYFAKLKTVANSGTEAEASSGVFEIDTVYPEISISAPYLDFSPDGVSKKQSLPVNVEKSTTEALWQAEIINSKSKKTVRLLTWKNSDVKSFAWDGTDDSGNKAENGLYTIKISSKDNAGNACEVVVDKINLDTRAATGYVTNQLPGISPNGDGKLDVQRFDINLSLQEGISDWSFSLVDSASKTVKIFSKEKDNSVNVPKAINWAGDTDDGSIADGFFTGVLHVEYAKGNTVDVTSSSFVCTANVPALKVQTRPSYFSPDNDGSDDDLFILLGCKTIANLKNWSFTIYDRNKTQFWKTSGKSTITEKIIWDGRGNNGDLVESGEDYSYEFKVTDDLGMTGVYNGVIQVDVLVVRDGSKLKMQVPSIIFRADNADFGVQVLDVKGNVVKAGITQEQSKNNDRVLKRISDILKKFNDYNVTIVGHANIVSGTQEEIKELKDLSEARAKYVKSVLVKNGISSNRLSVEGHGGDEPVASTTDKTVNWKNRRVEFILEK